MSRDQLVLATFVCRFESQTRMQSSRMRTVRCSGRRGGRVVSTRGVMRGGQPLGGGGWCLQTGGEKLRIFKFFWHQNLGVTSSEDSGTFIGGGGAVFPDLEPQLFLSKKFKSQEVKNLTLVAY